MEIQAMNTVQKVLKSFVYAYQGWKTAYRTQLNIRMQSFLAVTVVVLGIYFKITAAEWLWIALNITLVLAAELFNSAIEALVDFVSPGYHVQAGKVKDIAAAAVTLVALNALVGGLIIFAPKLIGLF